MSIDLNGTSILTDGGDLKIANSSSTVLQLLTSTGNLRRNAAITPMFYVGSTTASWTALTASTWAVLVFSAVAQNNRSCYSTSTGRFTAPTTGMYLLTGSTYNYQSPSSYFYPMFWVNGSTSNKTGGTNYRPKGWMVASGYAFDADLCELVYLNAGDYVEYREYSVGVTGYWYPAYSFFSGVLLG